MDQFFVTCVNCVLAHFSRPEPSWSAIGQGEALKPSSFVVRVKPHPRLWSGQCTEPTTVKRPPRLVQIAVYSKINAV